LSSPQAVNKIATSSAVSNFIISFLFVVNMFDYIKFLLTLCVAEDEIRRL